MCVLYVQQVERKMYDAERNSLVPFAEKVYSHASNEWCVCVGVFVGVSGCHFGDESNFP